MQRLTLQDFKARFGWVPDAAVESKYADAYDRQIINSLCAFVRPARVLEIGINEGRTAELLLRCSPWITEYVGVDVPEGFVPELSGQRGEVPAGGAVARFVNDPRLKVVVSSVGTYPDIAQLTGAGFGLVFIDADHSERGVERDTLLAESVTTGGACLVWHDYHPSLPGVVRFLDRRSETHSVFNVAGTRIVFGFCGPGCRGEL